MVEAILNNSGSQLFNVVVNIGGEGSIGLSPASIVADNHAITFTASASGTQEIVVGISYTLNGTTYNKDILRLG